MTDTIEIQNLDKVTTLDSNNYIVAVTDTIGTTVLETKADFIADFISTDSGNLLEVGTDDNLMTSDTITVQGNTFNGNSQLVQLNSSGQYPALDGSLITDISADLPMAITSNMPTLANNTTDANNDIDFSAGFCYDLSTNDKITNTALTKKLDAVFAEGTNAGGLDTGSKANSTWYHCFAISKADGTADFLFSTSLTSPTMPTDYINKRRIGSIKTDGSGNIYSFYQYGDFFQWGLSQNDINTTTPPTSYTDLVLSAPLGIKTRVHLSCGMADTTTSTMLLKDKNSSIGIISCTSTASTWSAYNNIDCIYTDTSSKIQHYSTHSSVVQYAIRTVGYYDRRGVN